MIDVITANTNDLGPLSLDFFRKNNFSASWKVVGIETAVESNATSVEVRMTISFQFEFCVCAFFDLL